MPHRRRIWKTYYIEAGRDQGMLQSAWQSCSTAFSGKGKRFIVERNVGIVETNLSYADLRDLFRFADVPLPRDCSTDTQPSWESGEV